MLYLAGIAITFFLVFILSSKKNKSKADKILALWLFFTGLHLLLYYIYVTKNYTSFPFLLGLEIPIPLLYGPFLFLYTKALTNQGKLKKSNLLHFVPFIVTLFLLIPFFTLSPQKKIKVYLADGKGYELLMAFIFAGIVVSGIFYTLISLKILAKHRKLIADQFSFTEKVNLKWLFFLIIGSSIIWLLVIFSNDTYIFSGVVLYVLFIGYFGIKQVGIFTNNTFQTNNTVSVNVLNSESDILPATLSIEPEEKKQTEKIKYEKSGLNITELHTIHKRLSEVMQNEKLFKNPELTLSDVAQKVIVHPNTLSQVINSIEQKNFYDYINLQRIEAFKSMITLPENQQYTLLSLAYECGFNSKTSFNRNFKKATNLSPTEYLKQIHVNLS